MTLWTASEIAEATGGRAQGDFSVEGVAFDSREIGPGDLFLALKGEATDGHLFLDKAFAAGAAGAVVSADTPHSHVRVPDTMAALNALGRAARARVSDDARIIGVTGSVGKTGTKEALFAALDRHVPGRAHRSVKSYNNHTGVPLSLARMPSATRFGIFEMGMSAPGELAALTRLVRPHVAIVTAIAPAHRAFFASEAEIAAAKAEIFEGLEPGGTALVPHDSPHRDALLDAARRHAGTVLTFGLGEGADIRAADHIRASGGGTLVTAMLPSGQLTFTIAQPGQHWVSNALAVLGAVEAVGGDLAQAGLAFADMAGLKGRGARHRIALEGGEALLIDESYNANPASMAATLASLGEERPAGRRLVILGTMGELGDTAEGFHAALADPVTRAGVATAILVGEGMAPLAKALGEKVEMTHVPDAESALDAARRALSPGDVMLVKGSNFVGLSTLVEALTGGKT